MNFPDLITELLAYGVPVCLGSDEAGVFFDVGGFYKSATFKLYPFPDGEGYSFHGMARGGVWEPISNLHDLAIKNYEWWVLSRGRFDGWRQPDAAWAPILLRYGLIEAKEKTEYVDAV